MTGWAVRRLSDGICAGDEKRHGEDLRREGSITSARGPNVNPDRERQVTRHHQCLSPSHDTKSEGSPV